MTMEYSLKKIKEHLLAFFIITFVTILVFAEPLLNNTMPLHTDGQFMTFPAMAYFKRWALAGHYPVWWIADSVTGNMADTGSIGFPWLIFLPLILFFKLETAWFLMIFFMFFLAGICMYAYLYHMTRHRIASIFGALLFMRSEWVVDCLVEPQIQFFLFPLLLLFEELVLKTRKIRYVILTALCCALLFVGSNVNYPIYLLPVGFLYFFIRTFQESRKNDALKTQLFFYGLIQIVLFLSLIWFRFYMLAVTGMNSTRPTFAQTYPVFLPPFDLVSFAFPNFFSPPAAVGLNLYNRVLQAASVFFLGHELRFLEVWYPGLFAIFFLCFSTTNFSKKNWVLSPWLFFLFVLFYMLGGELFLFSLIQKIPLFNMITNSQRITVITSALIPILACIGFKSFIESCNDGRSSLTTTNDQKKWLRRFLIFFLGLFVVLLLKGIAVTLVDTVWKTTFTKSILEFISSHPKYQQPQSFYLDRIQEFMIWFNSWGKWNQASFFLPPFFYGLGLSLFWLWRKRVLSSFVGSGLFFALIIADGFLLHPLSFNTLVSRSNPYPPIPSVSFLLQNGGSSRFLSIKPAREKPFPQEHSQFLPADKHLVYGMASVHGYQALTLRRYAELYQVLAKIDHIDPIRLHDIYRYDDRIADLLNVKFIVAPNSLLVDRDKKVFQDLSYSIYENEGVFPQAFLVPNSIAVKNELESLNFVKNRKNNLKKIAVLEGENPPTFRSKPLTETDMAEVVRYSPHEVVVDVRATDDRILVLSEAHHPSWTAQIEDKPTPLFIADHALRGVHIPSGHHRVYFRLVPFPFTIYGGVLLIVSAFALSIFLMYHSKNKGRL